MQNNPLPSGELILESLGIHPHNLPAQFPTREQRLQYRAVVQWLTDYKPKSDASNLEKVRGYLEAFHHLCELKNWERASKIIEINLDIPNNTELHNPLITWGYYREVIDLYSRLLGNLDPASEAVCFFGLGQVYHYLGNYDQAISYYKESLSRMLKIGYSLGVGKVIGSMGNSYLAIKEYELAISCYEECWVISKETNNQENMGVTLGNIGTIYFALEIYHTAIDYAEQHFTIAEKIGDLVGIGIALTNWGNALFKLGHHLEAEKKFLRASEIFKQNSDRRSEALIFYNWASFQADLGNIPLAIEYCDRALSIATELGIPLAKECQERKEQLLSKHNL
ncbi:Tetratricopeptide TPR_2 repeat-containing protein [Oscillatoria nigro-viridis PCC 7112]|uniref:Tetratricopeptide TPR_2 repeat-containing protein n=1 Tax=Phormidium nigroviride PCC 7112 TaxID=179408 RepID=K9VAQ2_9CYAN|nr:tetratricopeptide repeat protein [Oscillatoria nigro-viridis]AFZ05163.1 Tetratricopeptide TPR_2 repeat-containing protein [Oscillatoria nigro-viridis PCC 7112]